MVRCFLPILLSAFTILSDNVSILIVLLLSEVGLEVPLRTALSKLHNRTALAAKVVDLVLGSDADG